MTEAAATESAAPAATAPHTIAEFLEEAIAERGIAAKAAAAPAAAPAAPAKAPPPGFIDPLDDEHFDDAKLTSPEGIKAARDLLRSEAKALKDIRLKAHNARAEAERRESKFKGTKAEVLAQKANVARLEGMLNNELAEIQSGDPARFTSAIARLANKSDDPIGFWREVATHIATGKPKSAPTPETEELRAQLNELKERIEREAASKEESAIDQQIMQARVAQLQTAQTFTDLPQVARLSASHPDLIDARLVEVRTEHHRRTGQPLDLRAACGIVEREIQSHLEMLQPGSAPNGSANAAREAAAPEAGLDRLPERHANPGPATSAPSQSRSVTAIPASLSAAPGSASRVKTAAEKREATIAGLEALGVFANLGVR